MTKKYLFPFLIAFLATFSLAAQHKAAYALFNSQGKKINYSKLIKKLDGVDIVFFGESHNNSIAHWLQLELVKDRFKRDRIQLGAEMFEADNQEALNHYLTGNIDQKEFDTVVRFWKNYKTDYKPIVEFAKENHLDFIATNIPKNLANAVYKKGGFKVLDTISDIEKQWVAPLPITFKADLSQYQNMLEMMGDHGSIEMVKAQASKDATMAHFISKNFKKDHQFIHLNGSYHSDYYQGIMWYLQRERPLLKIVTITTVEQDQIRKLDKEQLQKADYILCVDQSVTKTY